MELAPIALFAYNRPDHLARTVASLRANDLAADSELHVFCDGPRTPDDTPNVDAVRSFARAIDGFASVQVHERRDNAGLGASVIAGVTEITDGASCVIVVEDDLGLSPYFLRFLNDGLSTYEDDGDVAGVSGFMYPHRATLPDTFFLCATASWGWATWRRGWDLFEPDGAKLLRQIRDRDLTEAFDVSHYPFTSMLEGQVRGDVDSWAVRWYASLFLQGKLTLFPNVSMVRHMGFDGSGTNVRRDELEVELASAPALVTRIPAVEDPLARRELKRTLRRRRVSVAMRRLLRRRSVR